MSDQSNHSPSAASHAIVIGGSMAGLMVGRVLADHFSQVTIVERDRFPQDPEFRAGVPQARHVHVLLVRGRMILEELFPGVGAELLGAGVPVLDMCADNKFLTAGGWLPRLSSDLKTFSCSRSLLEWTVRRRLAALPGVRFLESHEVTDLLADADNAGVAGVRIRARQAAEGAAGDTRELRADLVVDASGRNSRASAWLQALGYPAVQETTVNSFLGYASRYYEQPRDAQHDWKSLWVPGQPPRIVRGGVIFPLEGGRWLVTLVGGARDYPPTDEAGYLEFARSLASPLLYEAIKDARPLSPVYGYQRTENCLRHYERLPRWPERFMVLGDAVCAFNPVYGQGMTVAALSAQTLDACLRRYRGRPGDDLRGIARDFQRQLAKMTAMPWVMATGEDFRYPGTVGGRPSRMNQVMHWYMDRLIKLCAEQSDIYIAFAQTLHMVKPPSVLFRPSIVARVLAYRGAPEAERDEHGLGAASRPSTPT